MIGPVVSGGRAAKTILHMWEKETSAQRRFYGMRGRIGRGSSGIFTGRSGAGREKPCRADGRRGKGSRNDSGFCAGGVFTAEDMKSVKEAGAYGMQIATRFIATEECDATESFKKIIIDAASEDVCVFTSPVGMPGRGLRTPLTEEVSLGARKPPKRVYRLYQNLQTV